MEAAVVRTAGHQERGINVKTVCSGILHLQTLNLTHWASGRRLLVPCIICPPVKRPLKALLSIL